MNEPSQDAVDIWLVTMIIENNAALYSEHIKGAHNIIAEILPRNGHIPNNQPIHILHSRRCTNKTIKNSTYTNVSYTTLEKIISMDEALGQLTGSVFFCHAKYDFMGTRKTKRLKISNIHFI